MAVIVASPVINTRFAEKIESNNAVTYSWISSVSDTKIMTKNDTFIRDLSSALCNLDPFVTYNHICPDPEFPLEYTNPAGFLYAKFEFNRNYAILGIIIPMFAIFFLLGAIFIFDFKDTVDLINTRLVLTLGIFALIFSLPDIINLMKPTTSGPTIADSMLSIIVIATIAFTISSVLSSSSIIRRWFPKHYTWIDGIVFVIVSGIVIAYFSNFPLGITIWLVPIIVSGLGCGLLLRILGVKITKPLKTLFVRARK